MYYMIVELILCSVICFFSLSALGGSHGVPRVHYKGRQGDYYVMVCMLFFFFVSMIYVIFISTSVGMLTTSWCRSWIC